MQVTYNGENLPIFFENTGAPVSIQIALQFQEVKLLTRDGFNEYGNNFGESAQNENASALAEANGFM